MTEPGDIVVSIWRNTQVCIRWIIDVLGQNKVGLARKTRHHTWKWRNRWSTWLSGNQGDYNEQDDEVKYSEC
jgi:hypothetical protein